MLAPEWASARKPSSEMEHAVNGTHDPDFVRAIWNAAFAAGLNEDRRRRSEARALARARRKPDNVLSIVGRLKERADRTDDEPMVGESV